MSFYTIFKRNYLFGRFKFNANIIGINMHFSLWRGKRGNEKIKLTIITPLLQWQWHTILEKKKMKLFSHWVSDTFCVFCCHHHPSDTVIRWAEPLHRCDQMLQFLCWPPSDHSPCPFLFLFIITSFSSWKFCHIGCVFNWLSPFLLWFLHRVFSN